MAQQRGPKSPDLKQLAENLKTLNAIVDEGQDLYVVEDGKNIGLIAEPQLVQMIDALEWTYTYLTNRRDYHKHQQVKVKTEIALLEEALKAKGVDVERVKREASSKADNYIIDNTSDEGGE